MAQRQQLLSIHSMLDHIAQEAASGGFGLIATLSAAAAEAAREELANFDRRTGKPHRPAVTKTRRDDEKVDIFV